MPAQRDAEAIAARVDAVLARRGLGPDAVSVIDNVIRHASLEPPAAPPMVREVLARPPAAADAAALFERAVPAVLRRWVDGDFPESALARSAEAAVSLRVLLDAYLGELAEAQRMLRSASRGEPIDAQSILREVVHELPSSESMRAIVAAVERETLERATNRFLEATARFVRALRAAAGRLEVPDQPVRFDSPVGVVSIGGAGDDMHGPDAAVIVDPGGNDLYERAPASGGMVSVIVDLAGNDRYRGSDLVVHGLSAIVDFSGDDRYEMSGPGLGAAVAGASVLVDFSGDDHYQAERFAQGAAGFGLGALVDLRGDDVYRLFAGGQGFGLAEGVGLLWDRAGNDTYTAAGFSDAFNRGGGLSIAQGAAFGFRTMLGGGVGILRDDRGNDLYEAQMFAQGVGYYWGLGLLWDGAGADRYRAVRYAQGNGVHEAVGVLRDESGNDSYELTVGVGQGMGLDLAVGVLFDGAGDDRYRAPVLAQGTATANGVGIVVDLAGADRWHIGADRRAWGRAEWLRQLPSLGVLLYEPDRAVFEQEGKTVVPAPESAALGGPLGGEPIAYEAQGEAKCPEGKPGGNEPALVLAQGLRAISPAFAGGTADPKIVADVLQRLRTRLQASVAELPLDSFDIVWALGEALRCALVGASPEAAQAMWNDMERVLAETPATPLAGVIAGVLHERPASKPQMQRMLRMLDEHPRCGVRAAALSLRAAAERTEVARYAQSALRSPCWRLQAQALKVLKEFGVEPGKGAVLPLFLRADLP